jgi:hypothetical protein
MGSRLSWHLTGGIEESVWINLNQDSWCLGSRIEPRTSQIWRRCVNHYNAVVSDLRGMGSNLTWSVFLALSLGFWLSEHDCVSVLLLFRNRKYLSSLFLPVSCLPWILRINLQFYILLPLLIQCTGFFWAVPAQAWQTHETNPSVCRWLLGAIRYPMWLWWGHSLL